MSGTVRTGMLGVALVFALLAGVGLAALVRSEPHTTQSSQSSQSSQTN